MLAKSLRLRREYFSYLRTSGRYFHSEHFSLRTAPFPQGPRVGVSVSKKVAKSAVVRNRTRRRAYAAIKDVFPLEEKLYLLSAKAGADKLKGEELRRELADLLKRG